MPSFWETAKVFAVMVGVLFLAGWGVREALMSGSVGGLIGMVALGLIGVFLLWKLAGWIAFVMGQDW